MSDLVRFCLRWSALWLTIGLVIYALLGEWQIFVGVIVGSALLSAVPLVPIVRRWWE